MTQHLQLEGTIPAEAAGQRVDQALALLFPEHSRSRIQQWIQAGQVRVGGLRPRAKDRVLGGETAVIDAVVEVTQDDRPQDIPLAIVHEDGQIIVIDKPPGLVVHPAVGNREGTLVNALLHHAPELARLPRAGIVHRLDKDTSGLLVVARTLEAHTDLVRQLQARTVHREYLTLVQGVLVAGGTIEGDIGRHHQDRKRMAVVDEGKPAVTHYRVEARYRAHTLLRVQLETGRTHQIRVHMAHIRHPVVGDPVYGRLRIPAGAGTALVEALRGFRRQALHAARLGLIHPGSGEEVWFEAPLPEDMAALITAMAVDARER
ncbi:MAG: 23S rRNA pseudouridine(1911/1915/1917) synthase RluD [Chromatiales bacterium]|jgi:23S rRNA pseudouridine1911/1915/1917 synthase|nr:23S rRNA pseudouridine(1911/1915/1917) synthase RluD [Chromatiales bacterium]MDX9767098.1 23S rRNA pseudouridine(1911/1915/1917) synthase RluD [Ectothiorhodospiraceae bacterium]